MLSAGLAEKQNKISEGGNKWLYIQAPMSCIFKVGGKKNGAQNLAKYQAVWCTNK